mgnify:CR=1 FL=1
MAKTVSLNEFIYTKLAALSGEFTAKAGKPVSLGMTVAILLMCYETFMELYPGLRKNIEKILKESAIASPREFDKYWDDILKKIVEGSE